MFELDREKFIRYYCTSLFKLVTLEKVIEDVIKGGEFILTAEDILNSMKHIDGNLVDKPGRKIPTSKIKLIYKPK